MDEAPRGRHKLLDGLAERRERHLGRPRVVRVVTMLAGVTVLLGGLAMLVLPGPALAVIPIGLAILALEFKWAEEMLERAIEQAERAGRTAKEASFFERAAAITAALLAAGALVAWALIGDVPLLPF